MDIREPEILTCEGSTTGPDGEESEVSLGPDAPTWPMPGEQTDEED